MSCCCLYPLVFSWKKLGGKALPPLPSHPLQILILSSVFEAISLTVMRRLLRRLLKRLFPPLWQHSHCYFHTHQRDFLRNECNHAGTTTVCFVNFFIYSHFMSTAPTEAPTCDLNAEAHAEPQLCENVPPRLRPVSATCSKMTKMDLWGVSFCRTGAGSASTFTKVSACAVTEGLFIFLMDSTRFPHWYLLKWLGWMEVVL